MKAAVGAQYDQAARALANTLRSHVETIAIADAVVHMANPKTSAHPGCAMIDLHRGALVFGGGDACHEGARMQADRHGIPCYSVEYRMPPHHPHPCALDDCLTACRHVLDRSTPLKSSSQVAQRVGTSPVALMLRHA